MPFVDLLMIYDIFQCDESKPSCCHCTRYSLECLFPRTPSPHPGSELPHPRNDSAEATARSPSGTGSLIAAAPIDSFGLGAGIRNLELLHFYTATTSLTLCNMPERQRVWQNTIPQIAFSNHFLLHGLLAISALHLAYLQPSRKASLYAEASLHQNEALTLYQSVTANITSENCNACYAFSTIVIIYAWASSDETGYLCFGNMKSSGTVEWIKLLRCSYNLILPYFGSMQNGPLMPLLSLYQPGHSPAREISVGDSKKLKSLSRLWAAHNSSLSRVEIDALNEALSLLHEVYELIPSYNTQTCPIAATFSWAVRISDAYITMVIKEQPEALVLLAHYCIVLQQVDKFWWICGMSRHLLDYIRITLDPQWERWIEWPLQRFVTLEVVS